MGSRGDTGEVVVRIDPRYFRPAEVETLLGDPSKLGKADSQTTLEELVAEMVAIDVEKPRKRLISRARASVHASESDQPQ